MVIIVALTHHGVDLQHGSLALECGDTDHGHLLWQQALCHRHTVLHVHGSHVGVRALLKVYRYGGRTAIGGVGGHVCHVLHAVDALFEWLDNSLGDSLGRGTGIGCIDHNCRRGYVGKLLHSQVEIADGTEQHYDDGYRHCHHRTFDKYIAFHTRRGQARSLKFNV